MNVALEAMREDYPLLVERVKSLDRAERSGATISDRDQEMIEAMFELWLTRGGFTGSQSSAPADVRWLAPCA